MAPPYAPVSELPALFEVLPFAYGWVPTAEDTLREDTSDIVRGRALLVAALDLLLLLLDEMGTEKIGIPRRGVAAQQSVSLGPAFRFSLLPASSL